MTSSTRRWPPCWATTPPHRPERPARPPAVAHLDDRRQRAHRVAGRDVELQRRAALAQQVAVMGGDVAPGIAHRCRRPQRAGEPQLGGGHGPVGLAHHHPRAAAGHQLLHALRAAIVVAVAMRHQQGPDLRGRQAQAAHAADDQPVDLLGGVQRVDQHQAVVGLQQPGADPAAAQVDQVVEGRRPLGAGRGDELGQRVAAHLGPLGRRRLAEAEEGLQVVAGGALGGLHMGLHVGLGGRTRRGRGGHQGGGQGGDQGQAGPQRGQGGQGGQVGVHGRASVRPGPARPAARIPSQMPIAAAAFHRRR